MSDWTDLQFSLPAALSTALFDSLWQNSLLAVLAGALFALLGPRRPALRHTVGMLVLLAMLAVPVLSFIDFWSLPRESVQRGWLPAISAPSPGAAAGRFVQHSDGVALALSLAWMLGACLMLLRQFGGWRLVQALDREPYAPLPGEWQARMQALQRTLGIGRRVAVRLAVDLASPFTARWLRPVIWLPETLLSRLPADQIEALLAHELAHISRHDWLWNGLQCLAESLLFYHPAAWWLGRRIRREREHASDDLAVAACVASNPNAAIALAEALADLEYQRQSFPRLVLTAQGGSLMQRVTRLLASPTSSARRWLPIGGGLMLLAGAALAANAGLAERVLPCLHIESTTMGDLGPGDSRRIEADGLDGHRLYEASIDAHGKLSETYSFNGERRPVDDQVRYWVSEMVRLGVPPIPPPPAPPAPPEVAPPAPAPPPPPEPPSPPELADAAVVQELPALLESRDDATTLVGTPIRIDRESLRGSLELDPLIGNARAEFSLRLIGPKGTAHADVSLTRDDAQWLITEVNLAADTP